MLEGVRSASVSRSKIFELYIAGLAYLNTGYVQLNGHDMHDMVHFDALGE